MVSGYCNYCKRTSLLRREEFNVCLAIILLLFTAGIGLIIYLAIYYSKAEDRCIHCGNRIDFIDSFHYSQQGFQGQGYQQPQPVQEESPTVNKIIYCTYCGEKISFETKYCPNCGSKI